MATAERLLTTSVIAERLAATLRTDFDPREFRLSESGACPRKRVLRATGAEAEPFSEETAGFFERGHILEQWLVEQFRQQFPRRTRAQVEVFGPKCTGHIDLYFPAEHLLVEVKTANDKAEDYLPKEDHLLQLQAYLHFGRKNGIRLDGRVIKLPDDARAEIVYFLMGKHLKHIAYPVEHAPGIGQRIEADLLALQAAAAAGQVPLIPDEYAPDRFPCGWRNGEVKCQFWRHCWESGAAGAAAAEEVNAEGLFRQYADTKKAAAAANKVADERKEQLRSLEERLAPLFDDKGASLLAAGGVQIKRSPIQGRTSYDIASATLAGAVNPAKLEPFKSVSGGYYRYYPAEVKKNGNVS